MTECECLAAPQHLNAPEPRPEKPSDLETPRSTEASAEPGADSAPDPLQAPSAPALESRFEAEPKEEPEPFDAAKELRTLPNLPGCYRYFDRDGQCL